MIKILHTNKRRLVVFTVGALLLLLVAGSIAYQANESFKEEVNEIYYSTYYNLFINPTMETVANKQANIAYCSTSSYLQKLDVYIPKSIEQPMPAVIYIHGGGWTSGDKSNPFVLDYGAEIVKGGMAFVSVNYSLAPRSTYPAQNKDVDCALTYLRSHAKSLNIDMTKIGLMGDSAGGQLAAMAALTSPDKKIVKAVAEFYGPSDIWVQITRRPTADQWAINYIGSPTNQALAKQASPLYADLTGAPPFLLLHGTNDQTVHYDQSVNFAAKLKDAGVDVTLTPVQNANHYFSKNSSPNINIIEEQVVAFMKKYLFNQ